ncbi:hypothetical protein VUR80DRAFT_8374 [Thermomyces stellatus]
MRSQIALIKAPNVSKDIMRHGKGYESYIILRPGSNGNVTLGGYVRQGGIRPPAPQGGTPLHPELRGKTVEIFAVSSARRELLSIITALEVWDSKLTMEEHWM